MLFIVAMLGHIYIGTIGMEGAFEAMGEGTVDVNWAKQHHPLWLEDEMSQRQGLGRGPADGARPPNNARKRRDCRTPGFKAGRFAISGP